FDLWFLQLDRREGGGEQSADPRRFGAHALEIREGLAADAPGLRVRLLEQHLRLAARLLAQLLRRALSGHERRAQQRLELAVAHEILLESLDLVGEVRALAPHDLEAVDDRVEQLVDEAPVVTEE